MRAPSILTAVLALLVMQGTLLKPNFAFAQSEGLSAFSGEWIYVEDRTEGRAPEQLGPPMSAKFSFKAEDSEETSTIVLVSGHGSGHRDVRIALDGTVTRIAGTRDGTFALYRGLWKDGTLTYETEFIRAPGESPEGLIRKEFRITDDGLSVQVTIGSPAKYQSVAIYRHPQDIPMPAVVESTVSDLEWLAGAWFGTRGSSGTTSIEERWSPPRGGAMLALSRTVSRDRMTGFEYLRIVERDGGLVYIAQPGGGAATEFVLTELEANRAVFDNPRHDYPKRIVYDLGADNVLNVSIGFINGGSPRQFKYTHEDE